MDHKIIPTLASLALLLFLGYLIVASPLGKIDAVCAPITLVEKLAVGTVRMTSGPSDVAATRKRFARWHGACGMWMWRTFYEDEYRRAKQDAKQEGSSETEQRSQK